MHLLYRTQATSRLIFSTLLTVLLGIAGCAHQAGPAPIAAPTENSDNSVQRYRCAEDVSFTATVNDESAVLDGDWGKATLLRDAGGEGQVRVFSNRNLRAEFGLGADGRGAALHELTGLDTTRVPMHLSCQRE